mgnify:CR=1 FL=1
MVGLDEEEDLDFSKSLDDREESDDAEDPWGD